jgi:hypothetical protein
MAGMFLLVLPNNGSGFPDEPLERLECCWPVAERRGFPPPCGRRPRTFRLPPPRLPRQVVFPSQIGQHDG